MTSAKDTTSIVLQFNDCINEGNIDGLGQLMTDDHEFIDSAGSVVKGKKKCLEAWNRFFKMFPDYQNIFETVIVSNSLIIIAGKSTCSDKRLDGPALWTAKVKDGKVSEWQVYEDTPENKKLLGLSKSSMTLSRGRMMITSLVYFIQVLNFKISY